MMLSFYQYSHMSSYRVVYCSIQPSTTVFYPEDNGQRTLTNDGVAVSSALSSMQTLHLLEVIVFDFQHSKKPHTETSLHYALQFD